jgi:hypothetical protein
MVEEKLCQFYEIVAETLQKVKTAAGLIRNHNDSKLFASLQKFTGILSQVKAALIKRVTIF